MSVDGSTPGRREILPAVRVVVARVTVRGYRRQRRGTSKGAPRPTTWGPITRKSAPLRKIKKHTRRQPTVADLQSTLFK
jgi:hypothetical protein